MTKTLSFHQLKSKKVYLKNVFDMYKSSFPTGEQRPINDIIQLLEESIYYKGYAIVSNKICIGLLFLWKFEQCCFIEHFAIAKKYQNLGFGTKAIKELQQQNTKPLLLEVEPAKTKTQQKRIQFYIKTGFYLNDFPYFQPAYLPAEKDIALQIMSFPSPLTSKSFEDFKGFYFPVIYSKYIN